MQIGERGNFTDVQIGERGKQRFKCLFHVFFLLSIAPSPWIKAGQHSRSRSVPGMSS